MEINEKTIKLLSTIGPRASFGMKALDLIKKHQNLMIVTCDVSTSAGLDRFRKTYPENYVDLGIAEQNMIGVATGLARKDYKVITTTFAPFQSMRCCEQIKVNLGYMEESITMVGLASGLVLGNLGYTHCCIEDIGVLRSIPNLTIISPADSVETIKAIEASIEHDQSCYIRLTGGTNNPTVYKSNYDFQIGKAVCLKKGGDITIFSSGASVYDCLEVSKKLKEMNILSNIINVHTIKPIDEKTVLDFAKKSKLIVTVEEHNKIGGLGSAISETISKLDNSPKQITLGVNDNYSKSGSYQYLKNYYGLTQDMILKDILKNL
ncbi:hypothetical protein N8824_01515 [Candidatus Pelagibacter sp.]|nr:hypothetical protein [Candidatus Pelagibacter sp.]